MRPVSQVRPLALGVLECSVLFGPHLPTFASAIYAPAVLLLHLRFMSFSTMERTYIMIKPDGVQRNLVGEIIARFEKKGYKLAALKVCTALFMRAVDPSLAKMAVLLCGGGDVFCSSTRTGRKRPSAG